MIQFKATQNSTIQYSTIQYNTIQYNTKQYNTIKYKTIQYNTCIQAMSASVLKRSASRRRPMASCLRTRIVSCIRESLKKKYPNFMTSHKRVGGGGGGFVKQKYI